MAIAAFCAPAHSLAAHGSRSSTANLKRAWLRRPDASGQPSDHHVFKCEFCELEYPVVVQALVGLATDGSNG